MLSLYCYRWRMITLSLSITHNPTCSCLPLFSRLQRLCPNNSSFHSLLESLLIGFACRLPNVCVIHVVLLRSKSRFRPCALLRFYVNAEDLTWHLVGCYWGVVAMVVVIVHLEVEDLGLVGFAHLCSTCPIYLGRNESLCCSPLLYEGLVWGWMLVCEMLIYCISLHSFSVSTSLYSIFALFFLIVIRPSRSLFQFARSLLSFSRFLLRFPWCSPPNVFVLTNSAGIVFMLTDINWTRYFEICSPEYCEITKSTNHSKGYIGILH